jgi:crotonobetainyl-CoA:carnitine CoA-transferase CaiB-like acyl-CoA transferase
MGHSSATSPLDGIKVLDIAALFPAPLLAAMLGDYGADVVKVEPPAGDGLRHVGTPTSAGCSSAWALAGRNKRSIVLDVESAVDLATLHQLTATADVVITNQTQAQLTRWDCTPEAIMARNSGAVVVSLTGFGVAGPLSGMGANGTIAEAFSGVADLIGQPDGPPTLPSFALGDTLAATSALNGVLAALYWRDANGGRGQFIDATLYEPLLGLLASTYASQQPGRAAATRNGSRIATAAPRNIYRTRDAAWVAVSATTDPQVARMFDLMTTDDASRTRYAKASARVGDAADDLDDLVSRWIAGLTLHDAIERCRAARIPIAKVHNMHDVLDHEHSAARHNFASLNEGGDGPIVPAPTPTLSASPSRFRNRAPELGEHQHQILRDWLRLDKAAPQLPSLE